MTIDEWAKAAHDLAVEKGWWDSEPTNLPERLCLVHSEISEALEEYRNGFAPASCTFEGPSRKPVGFGIELADAVIRILDICHHYGISMETCLAMKHEYNKTRPYRHGGKRA
jgi:hypothetical protein